MLQFLVGHLVQVCLTENLIIEGILKEIKEDYLVVVTDQCKKHELKIIKKFLYIAPVYPDEITIPNS